MQGCYDAARKWENVMGKYTSGKKKGQEKAIGWEGVLLPKALIESVFYAAERKEVDEAQAIAEETQCRLDEFLDEQTGDDGYLKAYLNDNDAVRLPMASFWIPMRNWQKMCLIRRITADTPKAFGKMVRFEHCMITAVKMNSRR